MNELTPRQLKGLFWVTEFNLLFWLGVSFDPSAQSGTMPIVPMAIPGLILAAGLQHWAYHNLFKRAKNAEKHTGTEPPPA